MRGIVISLSVLLVVSALVVGLHFFWPNLSPLGQIFQKGASSLAIPVEQGSINETVTVNNAKLVPRESFELSFPYEGQIESISTKEGLVVSSKTELIRLNRAELELERQKAEAVVNQNIAHVAKAKSGTRSEEITVSSAKVRGSKTSLTNSKKVLVDTLRFAYTTADDAVRNQADQTLINPRSDSPQLGFTISDTSLEGEIEAERKKLETSLSDWEDEVNGLKTSDNLTKMNSSAEKKMNDVRKFLDDLAYALNGVTAGSGLTQATLDTWKAALATARTNISTAKSDLGSAFNSYRSAGRNLTIAESELGVKQVGSVSQDIDISRFQLEEAEQGLGIVEEQLRQTILRSPHDNLVVKKIHPREGERVQVGESVVSLATADLKIQIDIPEEDMFGIALGKEVSVTLESFPDGLPAVGTIDTIEPQEILKNESVYYRVYASLKEQDPLWRTGMTGDALIKAGSASSILKVPRSAVYTKNGQKVVQISSWNGSEEKQVITGLSDQVSVEIQSGITGSDMVIRYPHQLP